MTDSLIARAKYLLPLAEELGKDTRIQDGYVLIVGKFVEEVGQYTEEKGKAILEKYPNIRIIGASSVAPRQIPLLNCVICPGFVKAHGHDHESPLIGVAKDCPLTEWLDRAVNLFTGFMNENRDSLTTKFKKSPNLVSYLKARYDDIYYGITSSLVHHCNHNKYRVEELLQANVQAGTKMIIGVGAQDRNYDPRILDIPSTVAVDRLDKYIETLAEANPELPKTNRPPPGYPLNSTTWMVPGPDQFFSNGPELLKGLKEWSKKHNTLVHIHSSEEKNTTAWFKETYGMTPVQYGASIGFLDENAMVAHQTLKYLGFTELLHNKSFSEKSTFPPS